MAEGGRVSTQANKFILTENKWASLIDIGSHLLTFTQHRKGGNDEQVKQRTFREQQQFYLVTNSFLLGNMELAVVEILIYNLVAN